MGIPWKCYGNTMESHRAKSFGKRVEILWECFRSTVGAAWDTVDQNIIERSLESGGNIMGIPWEMLWEYYGNTVRMLCASFGNTPGMLWEYSGNTRVNAMVAAWEYHGDIMGILWQGTGLGSNFGIAWAAMEYHYEHNLRIIWE